MKMKKIIVLWWIFNYYGLMKKTELFDHNDDISIKFILFVSHVKENEQSRLDFGETRFAALENQ